MRTATAIVFVCALGIVTLALGASPARADGPVGDPFGPVNRPGGRIPAGKDGAPPPPSIEASIESLKPWLKHPDWVTRSLAARELTHRSEDGVIAMLRDALLDEKEPHVAMFLLKALAGRPRQDLLAEGGASLVDALLPFANDARPLLRQRALAVLRSMPPIPLGDDPGRYEAWWKMGKEGLALEQKDALDRREAARTPRRAGLPAPGAVDDSFTTPKDDGLEKFRMLDRIHRDGLDIVVCLDSTGSMGDVIAEAKARVAGLLRRLRKLAPKLRAGLVTYDDGATLRIPLTTSDAAVEAEFRRVEAAGGGDEEEGVDVAVILALRQERIAWSQHAQRVILVVGDAPPHEDDVDRLLVAIERARKDELYDVPVRVDTVSCSFSADMDPDGYVPHFREIAARGHGTAVKLRSAGALAMELMVAAFGPPWREPIRELLADVDAFEKDEAKAEADAAKKPHR